MLSRPPPWCLTLQAYFGCPRSTATDVRGRIRCKTAYRSPFTDAIPQITLTKRAKKSPDRNKRREKKMLEDERGGTGTNGSKRDT